VNIGRTMLIAAATVGVGVGATATASAQEANFKIPTTLSYAQTRRDTWNTVLIVSGAVMVVGLIQEETTLTLLGGAGVLISLVQLNNTRYRSELFPGGMDLVRKGAFSFGMKPFDETMLRSGFNTIQPTPYISASFKF